MVPAALRRLGTLGLIALWVLVSGGLLLLLALSVQNSVQYSKLQAWILLINAIAVVTVSVLLARKIIELVRAFRAQVPGSRLTARTVAIFGSLVIAPLIIVYLFSLEFLNRGIDSWFKVEIKQGLHRRARAVEVGDGRAHARVRAQHRAVRQPARRQPDQRLGAGRRRAARRKRRARSRGVRRARTGARGEQRGRDRDQPAAVRHSGDGALHRRWKYLLEPGAAVGRRLPDQHRGTYRGYTGIERRSLRGGDLPGAAAARATLRGRATLVFAARRTVGASASP